eukprot:4632998-Pleurochrysis_carterae.AAC.1
MELMVQIVNFAFDGFFNGHVNADLVKKSALFLLVVYGPSQHGLAFRWFGDTSGMQPSRLSAYTTSTA